MDGQFEAPVSEWAGATFCLKHVSQALIGGMI